MTSVDRILHAALEGRENVLPSFRVGPGIRACPFCPRREIVNDWQKRCAFYGSVLLHACSSRGGLVRDRNAKRNHAYAYHVFADRDEDGTNYNRIVPLRLFRPRLSPGRPFARDHHLALPSLCSKSRFRRRRRSDARVPREKRLIHTAVCRWMDFPRIPLDSSVSSLRPESLSTSSPSYFSVFSLTRWFTPLSNGLVRISPVRCVIKMFYCSSV